MSNSVLDRYEEANAAFLRDAVADESDEQLLRYLSGLANQSNSNTRTQHRDVIRGLTINNVLLKRHLDNLQQHISSLNAQNGRTQILVVALTVASLIGTAVQVWYGYRADAKADVLAAVGVQTTPAAASPSMPLAPSRAKDASQ